MGQMNKNSLVLRNANRAQIPFLSGMNRADSSRSSAIYGDGSRYRPPGKISGQTMNGIHVEYIEPAKTNEVFRILLIGDEKSVQSVRITLSSHLDMDTDYLEARSGQVSLRRIASDEIDLIVFGEGIEDMNALEFLDRLNQLHGNKKIPVIEILNADAYKVAVQAIKMGAHDYVFKDKDGDYFELLPILVTRIYDEKQRLNVLRHADGVHQTFSDSIPSVIYQLSLQGGRHDIRISPEMKELGFSCDKWGNDTGIHHQMCHIEDRAIVRKALEHSYSTGSDFVCEYRMNTPDNSVRWIHDKAKIVMDRYGIPLTLRGVMTDITHRKFLEAELVQHRGVLDMLVEQRTERLNRRVSILESCNSNLGENNYIMHQKYLELLSRLKAYEQESGNLEDD